MEWMPISSGVRSPTMPSRPCRARLVQLQLAHVRENFRERFAVPLGASLFRRWCISTTSRSKSGPRISAALRVSQNSVLTPVEKFDAQTIGNLRLEPLVISNCLGVRVAGGADDQRLFVLGAQFGDVQRGGVRAEINHHVALAMTAARSSPWSICADDFKFAECFGAQATSAWPMRPFEPVMMIFES